MHDSVKNFGQLVMPWHRIHGSTVLDVGSYDVNGSFRPYCVAEGCASYFGTDMREGPGVDQVIAAEDLPSLGRRFDIVICVEMLEHAENWHAALYGAKRACQDGGLFVLTTRSPGFGRHEHPNDYWRFTPSQILVAMDGFACLGFMDDPDAFGVFYVGRRIVREDAGITVPTAITAHKAPK